MVERDKAYLEERAEAELRLAQVAAHPAVVRAHYMLAGFYLDRLYSGGDDGMTRSDNGSGFDQTAANNNFG